MAIREKINALLEEIESSEEMIKTNVVDWSSRDLERTPGEFTQEEVTDPKNVDANRATDENPLNVDAPRPETMEVKKATIMIGQCESNFAKAVHKLLSESDWKGVKKFNPDLRVSADQVRRELDKYFDGTVLGIQVEEVLDGARGQDVMFGVTGGVDWSQYNVELPEKLEVENVELEKMEPVAGDKSVYKALYAPARVNDQYPMPATTTPVQDK